MWTQKVPKQALTNVYKVFNIFIILTRSVMSQKISFMASLSKIQWLFISESLRSCLWLKPLSIKLCAPLISRSSEKFLDIRKKLRTYFYLLLPQFRILLQKMKSTNLTDLRQPKLEETSGAYLCWTFGILGFYTYVFILGYVKCIMKINRVIKPILTSLAVVHLIGFLAISLALAQILFLHKLTSLNCSVLSIYLLMSGHGLQGFSVLISMTVFYIAIKGYQRKDPEPLVVCGFSMGFLTIQIAIIIGMIIVNSEDLAKTCRFVVHSDRVTKYVVHKTEVIIAAKFKTLLLTP